MRNLPKKSQESRPDPIVIKIDPMQLRAGILFPEIKYEVIGTCDFSQAFHGMVLPMPKVLLYYLNSKELPIVATIMEETNVHGQCIIKTKEICTRLKMAYMNVANALNSLRMAGLLVEGPRPKANEGRLRRINYKAVQHLNDLVEGEDPGIYARIRKATRKMDIMSMTKADILGAYDNHVLPPGHDPAEEEEYD